ncbi:MAG: SCO family protein [Bacteroidales bacterium]|nr:SCO family protein [Bacteroidales bacterium]
MKYIKRLTFIILIPFLFTLQEAGAQSSDSDREIGIVEKLNTYVPEGIRLINSTGDTVMLKKTIDKPTILNFVYYRCPGLCSPLMDGLAEVISKTDLKIGKDYQVLTVSFDPSEPIGLANKKRANYLNQVNKKIDESGWRFFVSDSASIAKATNATGFKYKKTGKDFLHSASLIAISPEGKITRYLNGTYFLPFEFKMSIVEASEGKAGPTINKVLQYCYAYDPEGQQYVLNITKVAGTLIIFIAVVLFVALVLKSKTKRKPQKEA